MNITSFFKKNNYSIIVIFLAAAFIPFIPTLNGLMSNPNVAYYNVYFDEYNNTLNITPNYDETIAYLPFINSINRFQFGDPLIKEYAEGYFNIGTALPIIPFAILASIFGLTAGTLLGIFICIFSIIVMIYLLLYRLKLNKSTTVLLTIFIYISISVFEAQNFIFNLNSANILNFFLSIGSDGNLIRFPSNSFTFMYFLISFYLLIRIFDTSDPIKEKWKQQLMILIVGLNGIIYLYNAMIFGAICGTILINSLLKKDTKSIKKSALICLTIIILLTITFLSRQGINEDAFLGIQKYGLTTGRFLSREGIAALGLFIFASIIYLTHIKLRKREISKIPQKTLKKSFSNNTMVANIFKIAQATEITDIPTITYLTIVMLTILTNMSLIIGFSIQHFHFLYYESFFIPLLTCIVIFYPYKTNLKKEKKKKASYKSSYNKISYNKIYSILKIIRTSAIIFIILLLTIVLFVNVTSSKSFATIKPEKQDLFEYINDNQIQKQTIVALDREDYYLIPIYTNNYVIIGNAFSTKLNSTENIRRLAMVNYLYNYPSDGTIFYGICYGGSCSNFDYFHWAYLYTSYSPPCQECTYDGKKIQTNLKTKLFFQIPDHHKKVYYEILNSKFVIEDYHIDYVILNKVKKQGIRWPEYFEQIYENEEYILLKRKY
ncbi:MAG: hypothetical protein ACP5NV_03375 [Candidatus Woesearchaeota archaeon]